MPDALLTIKLDNNFSFDLLFVGGGEFLMGDDHGEYDDEKPAHKVKVDDFYMGKFQVTQDLWENLVGKNPSGFKGDNRPVETISWEETQNFIKKLNKVTKKDFRLPTEAEWEYAARGGQYSQGYAYCGSDKLKQVGWYDENSGNETKEVGLLLPNELGIYDMSGNVYEWCEDWFDEKYYEKCKKGGVVINPKGPEKGGRRVIRGGSYFNDAEYCRPTFRGRGSPDYRLSYLGFRLVLSLQSGG